MRGIAKWTFSVHWAKITSTISSSLKFSGSKAVLRDQIYLLRHPLWCWHATFCLSAFASRSCWSWFCGMFSLCCRWLTALASHSAWSCSSDVTALRRLWASALRAFFAAISSAVGGCWHLGGIFDRFYAQYHCLYAQRLYSVPNGRILWLKASSLNRRLRFAVRHLHTESEIRDLPRHVRSPLALTPRGILASPPLARPTTSSLPLRRSSLSPPHCNNLYRWLTHHLPRYRYFITYSLDHQLSLIHI